MRSSVAFVLGVGVGALAVVVIRRRVPPPAIPQVSQTFFNKTQLPAKKPKLLSTATTYAVGKDGGYYTSYDYLVGDPMKVATQVNLLNGLEPSSIQMFVNGRAEVSRDWGDGDVAVIDAGVATRPLVGNHKIYSIVTLSDKTKVRSNIVSLRISPSPTMNEPAKGL